MNLEQCLTFRRARPLVVGLFRFWNRHAEALRELLDGIVEPDLLVELKKLDDVAARAAAKAVKEPLVPVDLKRRRLLTMERTEPLVVGPVLLQRHVVLDHHDDVCLVLQVVYEGLRVQSH